MLFPNVLILVRGAGDLATGVLYRLHQAGFPVVATETPHPLAVRRTVSFAQAVYDGAYTVEGVTARRAGSIEAALVMAVSGGLPVLPQPDDWVIDKISPKVLVDARLLKRGDATSLQQAALVIGLGPGFEAGRNCHAAIETNRGHHLGRVLWQGATQADTSIPGEIGGYRQERLVRATATGKFTPQVAFGEQVQQGQVFGAIENGDASHPVLAPLSGVVRGLMHEGIEIAAGAKLGDVDPRGEAGAIHTISDKSLAIGGAVLAAVLTWLNRCSSLPEDKDLHHEP